MNFWLVNHDANGNIGTTIIAAPVSVFAEWVLPDRRQLIIFTKAELISKLRRDLLDFGGGGCRTVATPPSPLLIAVTPVVNGGILCFRASRNFFCIPRD